MRSGLPLILLLVILVISLSACTLRKEDSVTALSDRQHKSFASIANNPFMPESEKTEAVITEILSCIEDQEQSALMSLIAPNQISDQALLEQQCNDLFQFFSGTVESRKWKGEQNSSSKKLDDYYGETKVSYDIVTSEDRYRIALRFCTRDSGNEGNLGLYSIYIIQFENADPDFSYWGDRKWTPGINVVTEPQA